MARANAGTPAREAHYARTGDRLHWLRRRPAAQAVEDVTELLKSSILVQGRPDRAAVSCRAHETIVKAPPRSSATGLVPVLLAHVASRNTPMSCHCIPSYGRQNIDLGWSTGGGLGGLVLHA